MANIESAAQQSPADRFVSLGASILEAICAILLFFTASVTVLGVFFRYVLNDSLYWSEEAARWPFVWMVFLGMALGVARHGHIAIDFLASRLQSNGLRAHSIFLHAVMVAACIVFVIHGWTLVERATFISPALGMPLSYLYLAVPVGGAISLLFLTIRGAQPGMVWRDVAIGFGAGVALFYAITFVASFGFGGLAASTVLITISLILILLGAPVAFSLGLGAFVAFAPKGPLMLTTISQNMTSSIDSFLLLAIPFFILAAAMMNAGGITQKLVALATRLVGHFKGGLGYVNVLTNGMMAGVSGSSMADAAAIGKILIPEMEKNGYPRPFSAALTSASSVVANLIPPSLGLIIYGALASASVGSLFVAAIVPGLMLLVVLAICVAVLSARHDYKSNVPRASGKERLDSLIVALPALTLPVVIVGGVRFGVFTATEAGAIAVFYAIFCGAVFYRSLGVKEVIKGVRDALSDTLAVTIIIATAAPFAWILAFEQAPQHLAEWLGNITQNPIVLILLLNLLLLATGLIMEMIAAMVILVPIFVPLIKAAGIDPVHFGVIVVINLVIGALTPPLGMLIFTTARVGEVPVASVFKAVLPFLVGLIIVLMIVSFFPVFTIGVANLIGPS